MKNDPDVKELKLEYSGLDTDQLVRLLPKLSKLKNLVSLNLSRNRLIELPKDLSAIFPSLTSLDISSNFFSDTSKAIEGLASLPSLIDLSADITPSDEKIIYENLRSLQRLNGVNLVGQADEIPARPPRRQEVSMTQKDLRKVASLFGEIRELQGSKSASDSQELTSKFDKHIQDNMEELSDKLDAVKDPRMKDPFLRQGEMLLAKHNLYALCFDQLCNIGSGYSDNYGKILRKMRDVHEELFNDYPGVLHEMRPHYVRRLADMQDEVVRAERETAQLLQAAEMLEKEAEAHSEQKELMAEKYEAERTRLLKENKRLRDQNKLLKSGSGSGSVKSSKPKSRDLGASKPAAAKAGKIVVRDLSLKQLKDHINAIFASKLAFDKKCKDAHLPRETMEQHMYTYLNQKYGLRSLIVEHATSIVKAMHMFAEKDNDVAVFQQVYENKIDEEFRFVQQRLKETVKELLRVYLKGKFPRKTDDGINEMLDTRLNGHVYEEEWSDIVKYMYNRDDAVNLTVMITDLIRAQPVSKKAVPGRGHPRSMGARGGSKDPVKMGKVKFVHFLHVLLTFQLKGHQQFLSKFRAHFKTFDTDNNGVLDETEMRQLIRQVDKTKTDKEIDDVINEVDPYNNQNITFSECVNVLSNVLVEEMSKNN